MDQDQESIEVHELRQIGKNIFVYPSGEITLWYTYDKIIAIIVEPEKKSKRQLSLDQWMQKPGIYTLIRAFTLLIVYVLPPLYTCQLYTFSKLHGNLTVDQLRYSLISTMRK